VVSCCWLSVSYHISCVLCLCFVAVKRLSMFLFKVREQDNMVVVMMACLSAPPQFLSSGKNLPCVFCAVIELVLYSSHNLPKLGHLLPLPLQKESRQFNHGLSLLSRPFRWSELMAVSAYIIAIPSFWQCLDSLKEKPAHWIWIEIWSILWWAPLWESFVFNLKCNLIWIKFDF